MIKYSALGLAIAVASTAVWTAPYLITTGSNDPYKPEPRSKGQKARNRKFRGR